jgi:DNA mismatch repair protein MLH3
MEGRSQGKLNDDGKAVAKQDGKGSAILLLPPEVIAQLKSSATITSLTGSILGLVQNSLDAGATKITIDVDFIRGGCIVEDNGLGIPPSEFVETGGLGKLYHTSKYTQPSQTYGTNGTFLASLASLCLLTITSKHHQHYSTNSLIVHQSKTISRLTPAPASYCLDQRDHGTRAVITDIFGNMPVRVKQRNLLAEDRAELDKLWEELKVSLTALLVAFAAPVSVRVRDSVTSKQMALDPSKARNNREDELSANHSLLSSKHRFALTILYQAGKISTKSPGTWVPASASSKALVIKGVISPDPTPSKSVQYLSLGILPLMKTSHNLLYDHINRLFSRSRFGTSEAEALTEEERVRRQTDKRFKKDGLTRKQTAMEKGVDRWPMFVLRIEFKKGKGNEDDLLRSEANMSSVMQTLDALVTGWLEAHHFLPCSGRSKSSKHATRERSDPSSTGSSDADTNKRYNHPLKPSTTDPSTTQIPVRRTPNGRNSVEKNYPRPYTGVATINSLSRIKSSHRGGFDVLTTKEYRPSSMSTAEPATTSKMSQTPTTPKINAESITRNWSPSLSKKKAKHTVDEPSLTVPGEAPLASTQPTEAPSVEDTATDWVDSITKSPHIINTRTGMVIPGTSASRLNTRSEAAPRSASNADRRISILPWATQSAKGTDQSTDWLDNVLQTWNNPVFRIREQPISQASFDLPFANELRINEHFRTAKEIEQAFGEVSQLNASKISKAALRDAKVIAQADEKFILIRVHSDQANEKPLLVAIDQHAADERCRVEHLLQELCTSREASDIYLTSQQELQSAIKTAILDKTIKFRIPAQEVQLLCRHASHFAAWGILYDIEPGIVGSSEEHVIVRSLPPVIAERCRLEPKLLVSLLRSEVWRREEAGTSSRRLLTASHNAVDAKQQSEGDVAQSWIKRINNCPQDLLSMVNSRACRSAIMFNDALTMEQCEQLVAKLAECVFPFQCAHGRPSMVPLIDLGALGDCDEVSVGVGLCGGRDEISEGEDYASAFARWQKELAEDDELGKIMIEP